MLEGGLLHAGKRTPIPLGVQPLINHQAMKVSSPNTGLKQTEQGAPQPHLSPIPHSLLPFPDRNFYEEIRDVVVQGYTRAKRQILKHQSTAVTQTAKKKKSNVILKAFTQVPLYWQ